MHFSHALILTFIATATAQTGTIEGDVAALPACAKTCLDKATLAAGCKSITDYACQCGSAYAAINADAGPCVATTCQGSDLTKTLALTSEICALVKSGAAGSGGGDSSSSSSAAAAPSSTGGSSSAAPTETGSSTGTGGSSTGSGGSSETGGGGSSTGGSTAAATTTGGGGASSTGGSASSTTGGGAAPSSSKGAAATGGWSLGAVAGAGVVALGFM